FLSPLLGRLELVRMGLGLGVECLQSPGPLCGLLLGLSLPHLAVDVATAGSGLDPAVEQRVVRGELDRLVLMVVLGGAATGAGDRERPAASDDQGAGSGDGRGG